MCLGMREDHFRSCFVAKRNGFGNMRNIYTSGYNAEMCLAPRRLNFGSGAARRMHLARSDY